MKAAAEIFKLASRINIKPKDIIGMGGDIIKMGRSLFNSKVNPELTSYITKKGEIPTNVIENIKIHLRSLKNASGNQEELFKLNLKEIVNAKNSSSIIKPKQFDKNWIPIKKEQIAEIEKALAPVTSVKEPATEAFKGWTPTVIKGGKDPKFNEGGVAKLNAELNQLPEYYLPMADGGIANHFRKK